MWSGPRSISTAMLRAWGNRPDTFATDEPLYGYYLRSTGLDHPGREEIIAAQPSDWHAVVAWLTGPIPWGKTVWFQKHMAHHLLDEIDRRWLDEVTHCFLIRKPREVLASYVEKRAAVTVEDLGYRQQAELFRQLWDERSQPPPVLDARDVLTNPARALTLLCERVGVEFREDMLSWAAGRRPTDGVWARHWYQSVEASTGFRPYKPNQVALPPGLEALAAECEPHYQLLYQHRIKVA